MKKKNFKNALEVVVPKEKYTVQLEAMDSDATPFMITQPEFMRRMKEMQQSGGNGMFWELPRNVQLDCKYKP